MDIKTTKLQNTQQTTSSTTVQTPTKTADGKSFIDEMTSLPELDNKNTEVATQKNIQNTKEETTQNQPKLRDFEFISTKDNSSFTNALNNNQKNTHQLKKAEKDLVNECVLMNEKSTKIKDNKNELKTAQASVAQKSDKEIEIENKDKTLLGQNIQEFNQNNTQNFESKENKTPLFSKNTEIELTKNNLEAVEENLQNSKTVNSLQNKFYDINENITKSEKLVSKAENQKFNSNKINKEGILSPSKSEKIDNQTKEIGEVNPVQAVNPKAGNMVEDMEVIIVEPIKPVLEVSNSITNSNKTNDIVKFIDANLSTENTSKTVKAKATSASSDKKSQKTIKMTEADANFFNNLVENNQQTADTKSVDTSSNLSLKDIEETHSTEVSKTLLNALKESRENNKAFRVDFDKDLSVILKVNKEGQISAEFLPGDKAVEQYLKANIPLLKQQFDDEGLSYENLSYRQHKKENEEEKRNNNRDNKKENGYE